MELVMGLLEDVPGHFKIVSTKIPLMEMVNDDNETTWWTLMKNMDNLKDYVGTTCILEPWNPLTPWRHVSYLTMSKFDTYKNKLKEFQRWPLSLFNVRCRWIMALVMGLKLEDFPWHFKRVLTKTLLMGMANDDNETTWWALMKMWTISNIMWARHASFGIETLPHSKGMCLI